MTNGKVGEIIQALLSSKNPCDIRKGECIRRIDELQRGSWLDRLRIADFAAEDRALVVICEMRVPGWIWANDRPQVNDMWVLGVALLNNYPMAMPLVRFLGHVPFNPHVVSRNQLPEAAGLAPELQEYIRNGNDGVCCYLTGSEWSPKASMGLPFVLAQVSRVLVGNVHGEAVSLNAVARDWAIKHANELPLGNPLPWPATVATPNGEPQAIEWGEPEAMEWIEENPT